MLCNSAKAHGVIISQCTKTPKEQVSRGYVCYETIWTHAIREAHPCPARLHLPLYQLPISPTVTLHRTFARAACILRHMDFSINSPISLLQPLTRLLQRLPQRSLIPRLEHNLVMSAHRDQARRIRAPTHRMHVDFRILHNLEAVQHAQEYEVQLAIRK
jgi:hypothetical protein